MRQDILLWRYIMRQCVLPVALEWMKNKDYIGVSPEDLCSSWEATHSICGYLPNYYKRIYWCHNPYDMGVEIDYKMGKISREECRKKLGFEE